MTTQDVAKMIRKHRQQLELKQDAYGALFDVTAASVSRWEAGGGMDLETWLVVWDRLQRDGIGESPQPTPPKPARQWLRFWVDGRPASFLEYQYGEEVRFRLATPAECASRNGCDVCGGDPAAGSAGRGVGNK